MNEAAAAPAVSADPRLEPARLNTAPADQMQAAAVFREALDAAGAALQERFEAHAKVADLVRQRATFVDGLIVAAWSRFMAPHIDVAALVAVGGYGRGELHPYSDIDVLILTHVEPETLAVPLQGLLAFLWDIGLEPGHSMRTPQECVEQARGDVTVVTTLIESRRLCGSEALFEEMRALITRAHIWPSREFLFAKLEEQASRHHRFDDTAYKLEPNVKEGPGGLRDIQTIAWVTKRHFEADSLDELVAHDFLTTEELETLLSGQSFLWEVRFALHTVAGRREDRLLFSHQRRLAEIFGFHDDDANLAVEKFMKRYYRAIMELSRLNEMLLELFQEAILLANEERRVEPLGRRFQSVNGFLDVVDAGVFKRYPFAILELFLVMQQHPEIEGVRASTIRLLRDHRYLIDDNFRDDIRNRSLFLEMLRQPRHITREFRRMHRYGILELYLPEFGAVTGQMQYDLFHAYTVDEHSLFVLSGVRAFAVPEKRHQFPLLAELFARLPKPEILYLAGLFHDLAKGQGGDHSELGAEHAEDFCIKHGLSQYDSRVVAWLVRHHLLMSMTAQRRDISDPDVIIEFAAKVGDQAHLEYLYLLTVADIRGTNPTLWNDWKASLLRDLYFLTLRSLRRGRENPIDRAELIRETQQVAALKIGGDAESAGLAAKLWTSLGDDYFLRHSADEVAWHTSAILAASMVDLPLVLVREVRGAVGIFVYAPDHKFLFAATTTVLGRLGLSIMDSRIITTDNGMTLDSYVVLDLHQDGPMSMGHQSEINAVLSKELRAPAAARGNFDSRRTRRHLRDFNTRIQVSFNQDENKQRTVMEVVAPDQPGLLARIGWALADSEVRLQNAKIATFGERAEDVFFLTDNYNKIIDEKHVDGLRERVLDAISDTSFVP